MTNIGDKGKMINMSMASRAVHITPDLERLAMYDEYPAKVRKQKLKHLLWFVVFAAPTVFLITKGYIWWSVLPGIISLWNLYMFFLLRNASPQAVYEHGLLCGAVIVSENPLQIALMAEMQTNDNAPVCWGVKRFDVKELPLHNIAKGERVPCAVMFGGKLPFAGVWSEMEPHPVCWATADMSILTQATKVIGENEWRTLELLADVAAERKDLDYSKKIAYFNANLSPRIDLQEKQQEDDRAGANPNDFLMADILWSFTGGKRSSQEAFKEELVRYNLEVGKREIDPDEIVEESGEVIVLLAYEDEDGDRVGEFRLTADNGESFTLGEILYKIHNHVVECLDGLDYHFFEGLLDNGPHEQYPDIPFYYLNLGS